jgi:hypothetical protein
MKKIIYTFFIALFSVVAVPALAATVTTFKGLINDLLIAGILKPLIPLLIGLAIVVFFYGIIIFVLSEGGEKKNEGKQYMFWGVIGIFVMVSVWGLVNLIKETFNLNQNVPQIQINVPSATSPTPAAPASSPAFPNQTI